MPLTRHLSDNDISLRLLGPYVIYPIYYCFMNASKRISFCYFFPPVLLRWNCVVVVIDVAVVVAIFGCCCLS